MKVDSSNDIHIGDIIRFEWEQHYGFYYNSIEMLKPTMELYEGVVKDALPYDSMFGIPHYLVQTNNGDYTVCLNQIQSVIGHEETDAEISFKEKDYEAAVPSKDLEEIKNGYTLGYEDATKNILKRAREWFKNIMVDEYITDDQLDFTDNFYSEFEYAITHENRKDI